MDGINYQADENNGKVCGNGEMAIAKHLNQILANFDCSNGNN